MKSLFTLSSYVQSTLSLIDTRSGREQRAERKKNENVCMRVCERVVVEHYYMHNLIGTPAQAVQ